jgi:hypothetical protein
MVFNTEVGRRIVSRFDIGWYSFWAGTVAGPVVLYWIGLYLGKLHVFGDLACIYLK